MMKKLLCLKTLLFLLLISIFNFGYSQTTVFSDDFSVSQGNTYSIGSGPIGSSTVWKNVRSGTDFGSAITNGNLILSNDATTSANANGWVMGYTNTSEFISPYSTILGDNPGIVTWTFNMRQFRANPSGFNVNSYGIAFILAGTAGTTNLSGSGYAVILGNTGTIDPVRLVRYNGGIRNYTSLLSSNTAGLADFGNQYLSIRITYNPATDNWQLFLRNDGATAANPATGTLISQGSVVNNASTTVALDIMGCYFNGATQVNKTSVFDDIKITVGKPATTSISPNSKIAGTPSFTLTVDGSGFLNGLSTVRWNGSVRPTTYVSPTQITASIPATDLVTSGTASIAVANGSFISNAQTFTIEPAGAPALTLSTTSLNMATTVTGTASPALSYTISGVNLVSDPLVNAPTNFEISSDGVNYVSSITLGRTGNNLTGQPLTLYARLKSSALAGNYTGNIIHSSNGAVTKNIVVTAKALATQPTAQGTGLAFSSVLSTSLKVNWLNGNGSRRVLIIREGLLVNSPPVDGETYTASVAFGVGEETATGNYVVYDGVGNNATITGLSPATNYYFALYEYNGSAGVENYLTTTPLSGNRTTLNAPVGWQIYAANTENTISFDQTVEGVNINAFQGAGLSTTSESGALVSNAWAVTGFSDGANNFGVDSAEDTDYDRGTSDGDETISGMYAFEVSPDNFALGIKPGTGDFAPGSITLKIQNQTGVAMTSLNVGYKIYVYNNTASSSNLNLSYSLNNSSYTAVGGVTVTTPTTADVAPSWKGSYRVATITGLNIASNQYAYIRFTGATVSGSANFDAFAIDDLSLVSNPVNKFVSFEGNAENFILLGNAELSNDLSVKGNILFNAGKLGINGKALSLNGTITNTTSGGLKGDASSTLITGGASNINLSFDQTTLGTTNLLKDLIINTSLPGAVVLSNALAVNGTLSVEDGKTLNLSTATLSGTLNSIVNNGTILTQNTSAQPVSAGKNWTGTGLFNYNAAAQLQTVSSGTYQNLTISTTSGASAGGNLTVNGLLNLPAANPSASTGSLSTGIYTLLMGANARNIGVGEVTGVVSRNMISSNVEYTFGHKYTSIIFGNDGTLPTSMSLKIVLGSAPTWRTGAINRIYDFIQTGGSGTKAVIKAHYLDTELNSNNESRLVDWTYRTSTMISNEQGRSNYNIIENFVDLTGVNVAFFSPTFGAVLLTLDESAATTTTWNGSISNSWTTAANWTPNATPSDDTIVIIPDAATTPNDPTINALTTIGSLQIDSGAIVNVPADGQLIVNRGAGAWINQGIFNAGTGTSAVTFTSADATMSGTTDFNNLVIATNAGLKPLTGNVTRISGNLTQNGSFYTGALVNTVEYKGIGQTIVIPNGSLRSAYNNLSITGTGAIFPSSLNLTGNLLLNQPVNFSGKTIVMTGIAAQTIGGTSAPSLSNLTINNSVGDVSLLASTSVTGTLTLTNGNLVLGNFNITLGVNPVVGAFDVTHMIVADQVGRVRRPFTGTGSYFYPIGEYTSNPAYSPISVNITAGTFSSAIVSVNVRDGIHPNNYSTNNYISRYWSVTQTGIANAVATITANYIAPEVLVPESTMVAAQLSGTFNVQTNPWIKFQPLSGLTLTAVGAVLTPGINSNFTGLKGGTFSAQILGYGSFCASENVTLTTQTLDGDAPYKYLWSAALGTNQTATPNTSTVGSTSYTVTVKDANGTTASASEVVTVIPQTIPGTLSANQNTCALVVPADITLSGNTGSILYWQSDTDSNFGNPFNISNTTTVLSGSQMGQISQTTYFRAVVKNGSCNETYSTSSAVIINSTIWDGASWSNGAPDGLKSVEISGDYTATANIDACTLTVTNNAIVVIPSNITLTLNGSINVLTGSFTLENNASLLQLTNVQNTGNIKVMRTSSPLFRLDYTMWSSPVFGSQTLHEFSPKTTINRFYNYNSSTDVFNAIDADATTFAKGAGYLIRIRNTHIEYTLNATPQTWTGTFEGNPNNGLISQTATLLGQRYNLIGNPYPSRINAQTFLDDNSGSIDGTIYFWRRRNNAPIIGDIVSAYYATYTKAGGVNVTPVTTPSDTSDEPNGFIQTGQGFIVKTLDSPANTNIVFTNSMRSNSFNDGQFFRTSDLERSRIWLNITNQEGAFGQMLVAYMNDAENGIDRNDGPFFNDANFALTSYLNNSEYIIQARAPFTDSDVVALNFKTPNAGNFTIAIDHFDGLFLGNQNILLRDLFTGILHDIKSGPYTFSTEAGNFNNRFEIVYQTTLGTDDNLLSQKNIIVYKSLNHIIVNAGKQLIAQVEIIDVSGKILVTKKEINANEYRILAPNTQQVLIIRIKLGDGSIVNKKIVY